MKANKKLTIQDFLDYHAANPKIWELFLKFTMQVISRGYRHFGAKCVMERVRWYINVETKEDPWKINNNFAAFYARKFMEMYPEYLGFFRRRLSVADALYPPEGHRKEGTRCQR